MDMTRKLIRRALLVQIGQPMLPLTHNLFQFGSWMGGDRDGNPFVTAETTRDVVISARLAAVNAFFTAIEQLMFELSIWRCNPEMQVCTRHTSATGRMQANSLLKRLFAPGWPPTWGLFIGIISC